MSVPRCRVPWHFEWQCLRLSFLFHTLWPNLRLSPYKMTKYLQSWHNLLCCPNLDGVQRRPNTFWSRYGNLCYQPPYRSIMTTYTSLILSHYFVCPLPGQRFPTSVGIQCSLALASWCPAVWPHDHGEYSCRFRLSSVVAKMEEPVRLCLVLVWWAFRPPTTWVVITCQWVTDKTKFRYLLSLYST